jgi:hypothetical protein
MEEVILQRSAEQDISDGAEGDGQGRNPVRPRRRASRVYVLGGIGCGAYALANAVSF